MNEARLAFFLPSLDAGGVEQNTLRLARGLLERNVAVDLVLAKAEGRWLSRVPRGIRVIDLRASRVSLSLPGLVRYLKCERPAALLSAKNYVNIIAICARRLAGGRTRVVVSVRINVSRDAQDAVSFRARLVPLLIRYVYPWADGIVAVSNGVAEDLARVASLPRARIRVIYNPIVNADLQRKAEEKVDNQWFAPGEPPVILGVGRLTPQKDFGTLIRAFALVRRTRLARLLILGDGQERHSLENLVQQLDIKGDVALPGFVDNPFPYMCRSSVFVLSSAWEGFGNVLVEAMACGTPVVSTDCPSGPAEILDGGRYGHLVPVGQPEALAHAIEATLDAPLSSTVLKRRANEFSVDRAADAYLEIMLDKQGGACGGR